MTPPCVQPLGLYRPRNPQASGLWRVIDEHFETFRRVYDERFQAKYGFWRPVVERSVTAFLKCGDLHEGFARVRCPDCKHEMFVAFSCKQRCTCPSCHQKRTLLTAIHVAEDVCFPVAHRQVVFTIPKRLRVHTRFDRKLLGKLSSCAWTCIQGEIRRALGREDVQPGMIAAVQTFGELVHWHPHIHVLVTCGGFVSRAESRESRAGLSALDSRLSTLDSGPSTLDSGPSTLDSRLASDASDPASPRPLDGRGAGGEGEFLEVPEFDMRRLEAAWREAVFALYLAEGKIEPEVVQNMRSWPHSGFHVDQSVWLAAADRAGIERVVGYMARCPFSLSRLVKVTETGQVIYKAEKQSCRAFPDPKGDGMKRGPKRNFQVLDPLEFLAEFTQHIPPTGSHLIRYYGWYSNKARGMRRKRQQAAAEAAATRAALGAGPATPAIPGSVALDLPPRSRASQTWAMLIKRVYEVDPLACPKCGGRLKVIAFIEPRAPERSDGPPT